MSVTDLSSLSLLRWPELDPVAMAGVSTSGGGVSTGPYESLNLSFAVGDEEANVLENRRRLAAAVGADLADFVFARQVHGDGVHVADSGDRGRGALGMADAPSADALVTAVPGVVLAILAADCVPIVLLDPVARVLSCIHAGWRGTVARAAASAVSAMAGLGAVPARLVAGIGPAIAASRYQVGPEVASAAADAGIDGAVRPDGTGRWLFDLPGANRLVLTEAGLAPDRIHLTTEVTGGRFFSDRVVRPCGRHALVARLT